MNVIDPPQARKCDLHLRMIRLTFVICFLGSVAGCSPPEPSSPKVDLARKRTNYSTDINSLIYPVGYPKELGLYKPVWICTQDDDQLDPEHSQYGFITWDTSASIQEIKNHYYSELMARELSPAEFRVDMPGENYAIRFFDPRHQVIVTISMGIQLNAGTTVHCFLNSRPSNHTEWLQIIQSRIDLSVDVLKF